MKVKIGPFPKDNDDIRKINIKFHKYDIWNLDHTLALIIVAGLKKFKENSHSTPGEFIFAAGGDECYDSQFSFDFYKETNEWATKLKKNEWTKTLDKMIWAFEQHSEESLEDNFYDEKTGKLNVLEYEEYLEKIKFGLNLFSKYFGSLWD